MRTLGMFFVAALLACSIAGCGRKSQSELTVAGSTSVQPFVEMLAEEYMAGHPEARVVVQAGGSTAGVQAVRGGAAQIGMVSRPLHADESDLHETVIARDGIAVVVHPENSVQSLTMEQVRDIFDGKIKNWKEVGGADAELRPVTREEGSGTRGAFQELVMGEEKITAEAMVQNSNGSVREHISSDPGAIGYISLGLVNDSVRALDVNGAHPTSENVTNGKYKLVRPFLVVTQGPPEGQAKLFIDYILSDPGQKLLQEEGLIAAK